MTPTRTLAPRADLSEMSEKEWSSQVVALARTLSYSVYHTYDSRRSQPGFPDLVLIGRKILYFELKSERGKTTPAQDSWLDAIRRAGGEAYVLRPSDLDLLGGILTDRRA